MNALVTGGSRGIGLAIAKRLAQEGYGVTLVARNAELLEAEVQNLPRVRDYQLHDFWVLDMGDLKAVDSLEGLPRRLNEYSVLVNSAGVSGLGPLETLSLGFIENLLTTNLHSPILLSRRFVGIVPESKGTGTRRNIILLSSVGGTRGYPGGTIYTATKAGIEGFVRSLAREVGRKNIAVNSIAPGVVDTDMTAGIDDSLLTSNVFPGKIHPDSVADAVEYLLKTKAVTGQNLFVDNGYTV